MNTDRKLITKKQAAALFILLAAAVCLLIITLPRETKNTVAVITVAGEEQERIVLSQAPDEVITLDNGVKLEIKDGKIGFAESDCKDKICISAGMLSAVGEQSACVPNRTVLSIEGADSDIDIISY